MVVRVLHGTRDSSWDNDNIYIPPNSLEIWTNKAPLIAFHYHAFTLYIALLLNDQPTAFKAIKRCQENYYGAEGKDSCTVNDG
jgi:hypothetical protein